MPLRSEYDPPPLQMLLQQISHTQKYVQPKIQMLNFGVFHRCVSDISVLKIEIWVFFYV